MDNFQRALRRNKSRCFECEDYRWCPDKVWVGEPDKCFNKEMSKAPNPSLTKDLWQINTYLAQRPNLVTSVNLDSYSWLLA